MSGPYVNQKPDYRTARCPQQCQALVGRQIPPPQRALGSILEGSRDPKRVMKTLFPALPHIPSPTPPPFPSWLPPFLNMNNSVALPICYCHRDRSSAKIMMFCAEPVGGEQHLRVWGIDFRTGRTFRRPGWRADVEDRTDGPETASSLFSAPTRA